jgi:dolichyl-phosphate beta-glucosyltransferase
MLELSIIIPAYNEEHVINQSLNAIYQYLNKQNIEFEILVVDDGSQDRTADIVREISKGRKTIKLICNERNRGKGYAVKKGVLAAKGESILFTDADLSTPIEEIPKLTYWLKEGYDIAIGSRKLPDSIIKIHQAWHRQKMSNFFNFVVNHLLIKGLKDTQCGFKCFKGPTAKFIFDKQKLNGFSFDVELLFIGHKYGYKIKEVPVSWSMGPSSKVHPLKSPIQMFIDLIKIRYFDLQGFY